MFLSIGTLQFFLESVAGQENMKQLGFLIFLLLNGALLEPSLAHGSQIKYSQRSAIAIQASFDDGTPMKNAQVVVYSPQDPTVSWLTGVTDQEGQFTFIPDSSFSGSWDVKVRQSGHGDIISIPIVEGQIVSSLKENLDISETEIAGRTVSGLTEKAGSLEYTAVSSHKDFTPWQKLMMTITSVWGFVGTAFFFSRSQHLTKND